MKRVNYYLVTAAIAVLFFGLLTAVVDAKCLEARVPDPMEFDTPQNNLYFPMAIGTKYIYWAETEDELILNEITITYDTVEILGVTCTVVYDVEWIYLSLDELLN